MHKLEFRCQSCGAMSPRWQGKCPSCDGWNTLLEESTEASVPNTRNRVSKKKNTPVSIHSVILKPEEYQSTGISECDHVLGKGLVRGSVTLLGGEPGIGKSTLALQIAQNVANQGLKVLYISGEESVSQIYLRAHRLGHNSENLLVFSESNILDIVKAIEHEKPDLVILDSIQVVFHPEIPSIAGSVNQVRQSANELIGVIKERHLFGLLIGHITKDGSLAGPKVLEHLVDVVLFLEGDRTQQYRVLRSFKNRYASTHEIGIFDMKPQGMQPIVNPSELFIDENTLSHPGSVVSGVSEGSRVILVEIQALVVESGYGMAKRTFLGVDANRANVMIATVEKNLGLKLSSKDIILNIVGGFKTSEPALDLGIILAMISSLKEHAMKKRVGVMGEIGLTGEVRAIPNADKRLLELDKMGFTGCILPYKNKVVLSKTVTIQPFYVKTLQEAMALYLSL